MLPVHCGGAAAAAAAIRGCRRDPRLNVHVNPGNGFPALVLNADFRPLSYYPLSLWSWQDAIKAVFLERVNIVEEYEHAVRSPTIEMKLPSVVSLKTYVKPSSHPAFTRFNVFLRDRFSCQYCGSRDDLTFDHLIPRSRGGQTTWGNVVAACSGCNLRKGNLTPNEAKMWPSQLPMQPIGAAPAPQRPAVPAELPARQLARLSLLGHRARSVIVSSKGRVGKAAQAACPRRRTGQKGVGPALSRLGPPYFTRLNCAAFCENSEQGRDLFQTQ